ncbi:GNAT family N-acyltransferase [Thiobacter aerophilum]|uniref:L-ornithine N(alpha)-acyltransferase n=1 Tax=Thiobacter aerophilum TaxID=3121275 RepID=A0ABV0EE19_9BURK
MLNELARWETQARSAPLTLSLARCEDEVREAQRLRYKVFAEEIGARLPNPESGLDRDLFDPFCEHLLVRDARTLEVVGTYRLLTPRGAREAGCFYSQTEFDLTRLNHLLDRTLEVGRAAVHPAYRNGGVITLLWAGLARFIEQHGFDYLIGCASIGMADGGHAAASLFRRIGIEHMSPVEWRVFPRNRLPLESLDNTLNVPLPPLLKGYIRVGCYVCGAPAWDPDFNTADLMLILPRALMNPRYSRHFLPHG